MSDPKGKGLFGTFVAPLEPKHHTPSHDRRYEKYGPNWEELANTCLLLAGHICQDCKKNRATNPHHLVPLSKGGRNELSNLRALCFYCHAKYHKHLEPKKKKGKGK